MKTKRMIMSIVKNPNLVKAELYNWKLESKEINQVYKLASKLVS